MRKFKNRFKAHTDQVMHEYYSGWWISGGVNIQVAIIDFIICIK